MLNNLVSWMHLLGQMIPQNRDSKISKDQPLINHVLSLEITFLHYFAKFQAKNA